MAKIWKNKNNPFLIRFLAFILSPFAVFFPACTSDVVLEYMAPVPSLEVLGKVMNAQNSNEIEGIRASLLDGTNTLQENLSDSAGNYRLALYTTSTDFYTLMFEDVDGVSNGEYQPLSNNLTSVTEYYYLEYDAYLNPPD